MVVSKHRPGAAGDPIGRVRLTRPAERDERVSQEAGEGHNGVWFLDTCHFHSQAVKITSVDPTELLTAPLTPELVNELLVEVIDPELGVNIVDLGLVYDLKIDGTDVEVVMTLTTQGCPLGGFIEDEIIDTLAQAPQIGRVKVTLVWEPPWDPAWNPDMMTDEAKRQLGWL